MSPPQAPRASDAAPGFELFESKIHVPPGRPAVVSRTKLVDRLVASRDVPITSVVAPAGYGKTTLLTEWAQRDPSRFAWYSIDQHDNDPELLLSYTVAALDRVEPVDPALLLRSPFHGSPAAAASRVARAMSSMTEPVVLVFDHVEALDNDACLDTLAELALHIPDGSRLALATRREPPLPMPRLRADRAVTEVDVADLAMDGTEARGLLEAAGVRLADTDLVTLVERTEGWPVGLYLAALAVMAGGSEQNAGVAFSGDDRFMSEYLRSEVLGRLSDAEVTFLTRTAVLDRMTGSLCDAVLDASGSARVLDGLAHSNFLVVPIDRQGEWYRYHQLFRDLLRAELRRREPELISQLHLRAAEWYEAKGFAELAINHAQASGDADRVNRLILVATQPAFVAGRAESVRRWMLWFEDEGLVDQYPAAAALGAVLFSRVGDVSAVERWAAAAEHSSQGGDLPNDSFLDARGSPERILPDGNPLAVWLALLRALLCRRGLDEMRRDAQIVIDLGRIGSTFHGTALLIDAISYVLEDDLEQAEPALARAFDAAMNAGVVPTALVSRSEQAVVAMRRRHWAESEDYAAQALSLVQTWRLEDYGDSALAYAVSAAVALHRGEIDAVHAHLTEATRLRPILTHANPVVSAQSLLEMAHVYIGVGDTAGARGVLRQARDILQHCPDLGVLPKQADEIEAKLDTSRSGRAGASSLTPAELRLVPFLSTHLTFPQIAERLFVSRNTIKSQAISTYQKLGVSTRGDAIERLQEIGLLDT